MKRLASLAAALAVAVASPSAASEATTNAAISAVATELGPDESQSALLAASVAVMDARDHAAPVLAERDLKPGGYWWDAKRASSASGATEVVVSLADQMAFVYRGSELIGVSTISSGMPGKDTPPGIFPILEKKRMHHSRKYDNAPMPFMQRLDQYGIAIHAGALPGRPASKGCVRLPNPFAAKLFAITDIGDRVVIG